MTMKPVTTGKLASGHVLGLQMCEALGIDGATKLVIECSVDDIATITITKFVDKHDVHKIRTIIEQYELRQIEIGRESNDQG